MHCYVCYCGFWERRGRWITVWALLKQSISKAIPRSVAVFCTNSSSFLFLFLLDSWQNVWDPPQQEKDNFPTQRNFTGLRVWLDMATLCIKHASKPMVKSRLNSHLHGVNTKRYWVLILFTTRTTESCRQHALGLHNTSFRQQHGYWKPSTQSKYAILRSSGWPRPSKSFSIQPCKLICELHMGACFSTPSPPEQRKVKRYNGNRFDCPFISSHTELEYL